MATGTLITQAEYAKSRKISKTVVTRQVRKLEFPMPGGLIDAEALDKARESLDPSQKLAEEIKKQEQFPVSTSDSLFEARRQREWLTVAQQQLDLARAKGDQVDLAAVNTYVSSMILKASGELQRLPGELRDRLAQETDPVVIEGLLASRFAQILAAMKVYTPE